jgi:hypothetical protein
VLRRLGAVPARTIVLALETDPPHRRFPPGGSADPDSAIAAEQMTRTAPVSL